MAEKYDERFDQLTGLVQKVAGRADELQLDMRDMRKDMQSQAAVTSSRFDRIETTLQIVSGRQEDALPRVIEIQNTVNRISEIQAEQNHKILQMMNRLDVVEAQLRSINDESAEMKSEIGEIRSLIDSLIDPVRIGWDLRENIREIEQRVTDIERKLDN